MSQLDQAIAPNAAPRHPVMADRQKPLLASYEAEPSRAWVTDHAESTSACDPRNPMRGHVIIGPAREAQLDIALHTAVGGDSLLPVPGDLLCAALSSCLDSTLRVVANRLGIELSALSVVVDAEVDVRGTLMVSPDVPVGFQRLSVRVDLQAAPGTSARKLELLPRVAEHCCVVMQTLRNGVDVQMRCEAR